MPSSYFVSRARFPASIAVLFLVATSSLATFPEPVSKPYLGQSPPGPTAELFAPGVVSTDAVELNSVLTPDGREFFFSRLIEGPDESENYPGKTRSILHHTVYDNGAWTDPVPLRPQQALFWRPD